MSSHFDPGRQMPFDIKAVGAFSRGFSEAVFAAWPAFREHAGLFQSGEADGLSLVLNIPSPTGDSNRTIVVWVDEVATPSIGFGPSHTHGSADDRGIAEIIELLHAILEGKLLIREDIGGTHPGHSAWIDLREPGALEEELTSRYSPGHLFLRSYSGRQDREIDSGSL